MMGKKNLSSIPARSDQDASCPELPAAHLEAALGLLRPRPHPERHLLLLRTNQGQVRLTKLRRHRSHHQTKRSGIQDIIQHGVTFRGGTSLGSGSKAQA